MKEKSREDTHSFILRIWLEENSPEGWRGHLTHVASKQKKHIQSIEELNSFIYSKIGVNPSTSSTG